MKILGVYNFKGGVGKTTSAVNLAYLAALEGKNTLIWDLDPQGSASYLLQIESTKASEIVNLIQGKLGFSHSIKHTKYPHLDMLPSDFSIRNIDIVLDEMKKSKKKLKSILDQLNKTYSYIIIDCPPGLSVLSEHVFHAVDYLLTPLIPNDLSVRTYNQIISYFEENDLDTRKILPFFSMVDSRKKIHKDIMEQTFNTNDLVLKGYIKYTSDIERMGMECAPLPVFAKTSKSTESYLNLWKEIKKSIK